MRVLTLLLLLALSSIAAAADGGRTAEGARTPRENNPHKDHLAEIAAAQGDFGLVLVGDSITQNWRWVGRSFLNRLAPRKPLVLGVGGEKTENILWRLQNGALEGVKARVAVVLAGTNNLAGVPGEQPAWVAGGVAAIVTTIRERLPGCRVLVLGILPRGREATDPFRAKIAEVNTHLATLADGKEVFYEDLASAFLNPDGRLPPETFPDALHPNAAGYERFVAALEPILKRME